MKRFSIVQDQKRCYVCNTDKNIHTHEVFFGKNRTKSIEDGCCVYLCGKHHNLSKYGVHFDKDLDLLLKRIVQKEWMKHYNKTNEDFIKRFGRNYL